MKRLLAIGELEQVLAGPPMPPPTGAATEGAPSRGAFAIEGMRARVIVTHSSTPDPPVSPAAPAAYCRSPRASRAHPAGGSVPIGDTR